ncbi:MAG: pyridoxal-phosphate dependent enzyme [Bacteroidetes bacterium]|nr:pyridoxal-phosphate dependent enzyme [Bacteroidota bacterium]
MNATTTLLDKLLIAPPIARLHSSIYDAAHVAVSMARFDAVHPSINGNKPFKLYYNIQKALQQQNSALLTFGGPYSNHVAATAATGNLLNLQTIGLIRGDELTAQSNKTLKQAELHDMHLHFVSRSEYSLRNQPAYLAQLQCKFPNAFIIPEGGDNSEGVKGAALMLLGIANSYSHIITAVGTGATCSGIALGSNSIICGIVVHKQLQDVHARIQKNLNDNEKVRSHIKLIGDFHFGGYGKRNNQLSCYCNSFYHKHGIAIEPIYTGKMMYGVDALVRNNYFEPGANILCLHTGGLQYL